MGSRRGPYNITLPAVSAQDVELFLPLAAHDLGYNSTVPELSLSGVTARSDVRAHLIARHAFTPNLTLTLDNLPPGALPVPILDHYRVLDSDVLWARYKFCLSTLESANEIITPPDSATGIAVYRWKYGSADLEDDQTVIDAFHKEIGDVLAPADSRMKAVLHAWQLTPSWLPMCAQASTSGRPAGLRWRHTRATTTWPTSAAKPSSWSGRPRSTMRPRSWRPAALCRQWTSPSSTPTARRGSWSSWTRPSPTSAPRHASTSRTRCASSCWQTSRRVCFYQPCFNVPGLTCPALMSACRPSACA